MLSILHSFYRPTCLALCVLLGLACGHMTDTVLQMKLRPEVKAVTRTDRSVASLSTKTATADLNLILQNNLFDAGARSAEVTMNRVPIGAGGEGAANTVSADIKLFGTVVAGEQSQALLEVNKELKLYHLGDKLSDGGILEDIQRNQVTIKNRDQSLKTLSLHEKESLATGRETAPSATGSGDGSGDIRAVGENRWMIARNAVEAVRENFADQLRLVQMQPRTVAGKTDGFLVQRINPRSMLAKLGLQRGDVVIDVNNIKLDSPEKALQVFQQLREARQITIAVERNGQPMSFAYEIE